MGRLDHLVEAVYDRFKDRYFRDESACYLFSTLLSPLVDLSIVGVLVDLGGTKYDLRFLTHETQSFTSSSTGITRSYKRFLPQNLPPTKPSPIQRHPRPQPPLPFCLNCPMKMCQYTRLVVISRYRLRMRWYRMIQQDIFTGFALWSWKRRRATKREKLLARL